MSEPNYYDAKNEESLVNEALEKIEKNELYENMTKEERKRWWLPLDTLLAEKLLGKITAEEFFQEVQKVFEENEVS